MEVKIFSSEEELTQWWKYFKKLKSKGIYHSPDYILLLEKHFYKESKAELFIYGDEENFVYYPYFKRTLDKLPFANKIKDINLSKYFDIVSSWYYGGPLLEVEQDLEAFKNKLLKEFAKKFNIYCKENNVVSMFIRFDPLLKNYELFDGILNPEFNRLTIYVDLDQSEEKIWKNFEIRNRTCIRRAKENGIVIDKSENLEDIDIFTEIYGGEMKRKEANKHYWFDADFLRNLQNVLGDRFQLFMCKYKGDIIGGGIVVRDHGIAHNYLMATNFDYWQYHPNNYLLFEEIKWCQARGDKIFDLQGGRPGVFNFKKAFSSDREKFYIARIILNKEAYNELVNISGRRDILDKNKNFPEYRHYD